MGWTVGKPGRNGILPLESMVEGYPYEAPVRRSVCGRREREGEHGETGDRRGIGERINQTKGGDAGGLSALIVPLKAGNRVHRDPREGAGIMPTDPLVGNEERNPECYRHGHETTGDRRTGEAAPGPGVPVPAPSDRHRMEARGVPPDAEGRCGGHGRRDGGGR